MLEILVSKQMLRQGVMLQCRRCERHDWYHLSELADGFKCKKCFHYQTVPMLGERPWHFVSDGLLRLRGKLAGCLTSVLSLAFLKAFLDPQVKYIPSFDYENAGRNSERDFAILVPNSFNEGVDVIIGECKTALELENDQKKDIDILGTRTTAFIAVSTLADQFSDGDKTFFESLVGARAKLILLTRRHLEMSQPEIGRYRSKGVVPKFCPAEPFPKCLAKNSLRNIMFGPTILESSR